MRYINTKTGAIIDSSFSIEGENWILFEMKKDTNDLFDMKKSELISYAETHDIKINTKEKKEHILDTILEFLDDKDDSFEDENDTDNDREDSDAIVLRDLKKDELIRFADEHGIEINPNEKKEEILTRIIDYLEENEIEEL